MKLLTIDRYAEYVAFLESNKKGHFLQSPQWARVKDMWANEVLIAEDENGKIKGSMSLLIRKVPVLRNTIMYSPRGPVCDIYDKDTIEELVDSARELAKKYKSYVLKIDPDINADDEKFCKIMSDMGFRFNKSKNFEGVQPRFVFRKTVTGMTEDEVFASFHSKTRYNVRLAIKKGCEVRLGTREDLPAFCDVMMTTGVRDKFIPRSLEYFQKMYDEMGDYMRLYLIYYEGKLLSGAVAILYGNKVWYLYGASSNEHRNVMPNYLMQWEMLKWTVQNGCDIYDFRGVSGDLNKGQPLYGLYRFKQGFSGDFLEFVGALDYILNPFMYFIIEKGERLYRELRRRLFLRKHKADEPREDSQDESIQDGNTNEKADSSEE